MLMLVFLAKSRRSLRAGRWTTGWSLWLWPTTGTLTCRRPPWENAHLLCRPCSEAFWELLSQRPGTTVLTVTSQLTLWAHVYFTALMFFVTGAFTNFWSSSGSLPLPLLLRVLPLAAFRPQGLVKITSLWKSTSFPPPSSVPSFL